MAWGREIYDSLLLYGGPSNGPICTCEIWRRPSTAQQSDSLGQPSGVFSLFASAVPCLYEDKLGSGGEQKGERSHDVVVSNAALFLLAEQALVEADEIRNVRSSDGTLLIGRADVNKVSRPLDGDGLIHHTEVKLFAYTSGEAAA